MKVTNITEIETNRIFRLETERDYFFVQIPKDFLSMTPNQLWLLEHQITAFGHGMDLNNCHILSTKDVKPYRYPNERKWDRWVRVDPSVQENNLRELLSWYCDYKDEWNNGQEYDCHPKNFDEFLNQEKKSSWSNRLLIFFMIVLLQDINCENVRKVKKVIEVKN
ncbi:MAG TPA: hypothetical protein VLA08_06935 [Nitrosopumilus sp.]|nr:hypothetical protein [Nitrosopumilus sp.]